MTGTPTATPTNGDAATSTATPTSSPTPAAGDIGPTPQPEAPQCSDGVDNDSDGDVDGADPGCGSPNDTSETDEADGPLAVMLEGIYDNQDGSYTAYLSYLNTTDGPLVVPVSNGPITKNIFAPGVPSRGQPTTFLPGVHIGEFYFTFKGEPVTWTVKGQGGEEFRIPISAKSPKLPFVSPLAECINLGARGQLVAVFGYSNPNDFDIHIPVGILNRFVPGKPVRAQPSEFFSGLNRGALSVPFRSAIEWKLPGSSSKVSPLSEVCSCPTSSNAITKNRVLKTSEELGSLVFEAAERLEAVSHARLRGASPRAREKLRQRVARAKEKAAAAMLFVRDQVSKFPVTTKSCPDVPPGCKRVDDGPTIRKLRDHYHETLSLLKRINSRVRFVQGEDAPSYKRSMKRGEALAKEGLENLRKVPRFRIVCK